MQDAQRFGSNIKQAMLDMLELFQLEPRAPKWWRNAVTHLINYVYFLYYSLNGFEI